MPNGEHESAHEGCTQHSGVESRQSSVLWLLSILIVINLGSVGWQFLALGDVKDRLADTKTSFVKSDAEDKALREKILLIEQQVQVIQAQLSLRVKEVK